jgi:hypothetical protein
VHFTAVAAAVAAASGLEEGDKSLQASLEYDVDRRVSGIAYDLFEHREATAGPRPAMMSTMSTL